MLSMVNAQLISATREKEMFKKANMSDDLELHITPRTLGE